MAKQRLSKQTIILVILVIILAVQNYFLSKQNTELLDQNFRVLREQNARGTLAKGDSVESFYAYDAESSKVFIDLDKRKKTILMVFSTRCHACKENNKYWDAIVARYDTSSTDIVLIGLDTPQDLKTYHPISSKAGKIISVIQDTSLIRKFKFFQTPQTIIVDRDKKILQSLAGVLTSNDVDDIISQSN